jgi:hypothetical protein
MPSDIAKPPRFDPTRLPAACARGFGTAVVVVSLFVFMLATPPFACGVWFQTEPGTVGLLALGVAAGLSLMALDLTGHSVAVLLSRRHIQVLLAFVVWNAAVSLAQDFPGRSWFGTPETGQGIFSFMALAMLTMLAMALWPYRLPRLGMVGAAVLAALTIGGLDALLPITSPWRPEKYAGYAGTVGPPVAMIVAGAFRRVGWRMLLSAATTGLAPVAFSGNKTAILLLCVAAPVLLVPILLTLRTANIVRARRVLAWMPVGALLLTCACIAGAMAYGDYDPLYSVRSRGLLIWAALLNLRDHPLAWLIGFGWGSFNDLLYWHNFLPGVRGFVNGAWAPNWEGLGAGAFHVHNDIFEAVLGGGAISGALYLFFFATVVAGARRRMLGIAAVGWFLIVGSLCFWYPFMLCFPFLALAIAATAAPAGVLRSPIPIPMEGWVRGAGSVAIGILAVGCLTTWQDARMGGDRLAALNRQNPAEIPVFGTFPPDHGRGGVHLWWLALSEAAFVGGQTQAGRPPTPAQAQWYGRMLDEVDAWTASGRAGMRLRALTLALRNDLIAGYENTALAALRERELPRWEQAMLRTIAHAPDRTDVAVPFMAFLALTKQYSRIEGVCVRIEAIHPRDRVCQWYTGLARLENPATEQAGLASMRAALAEHVEAVAPVPDAARTMIESLAPAAGP